MKSLNELREQMASGAPYDDNSPHLVKQRQTANRLLREYHDCYGAPMEERLKLLEKLCRKVGKNVHCEPGFRCEFGFNISFGDNFYGNADLMILDGGTVTFGDNVLIGPKCGLYTTNHLFDPTERLTGGVYARPITVGNQVWLCGGVSICPGVTIGDGSIIGAGSVVTKDIPAGVIAAGNPCKVIRKITEQDKTGFCLDLE